MLAGSTPTLDAAVRGIGAVVELLILRGHIPPHDTIDDRSVTIGQPTASHLRGIADNGVVKNEAGAAVHGAAQATG